jgi:hypothetical protein
VIAPDTRNAEFPILQNGKIAIPSQRKNVMALFLEKGREHRPEGPEAGNQYILG